MYTLGKIISVLRKQQNMTQEALANLIGVSAQSVSKWESDINMPDISLLPLLADIFHCRIDDLFGRGGRTGESRPEQALNDCCEAVLDKIGSLGLHFEADGERSRQDYFAKTADYKRALKENPDLRSGIFYPHGMVYYREELGALLLKRPEAGWHSLLEKEGPGKVFRMLEDDDFRTALAEICRHRIFTFTLSYLCSRCEIQDPASLERNLKESHVFRETKTAVDGGEITVYEVVRGPALAMLFGVLLCAAEYGGYRENYRIFYTNDILGE